MPKIQIINPIPVNNGAANALLMQGLQGLATALNPLQLAIKDASDKNTQNLTGLAQQYINQGDPNNPDFQKGLEAIKQQAGLGSVNEQELAKAIYDRTNQIPAIAASQANTQGQILKNNIDSQFGIQQAQMNLAKDAAQIANYDSQNQKREFEMREALNQQNALQALQPAVAELFSQGMSPERFGQVIQRLPPQAIEYMVKTYGDVNDRTMRQFDQEMKWSELLAKDPALTTNDIAKTIVLNASKQYPQATPEQIAQLPQVQQEIAQTTQRVQVLSGSLNQNPTNNPLAQAGQAAKKFTAPSTNQVSGLRSHLFKGESGKAEGDYNIVNKGAKHDYKASKEYTLENMSVGEVRAHQDKGNFNAAGGYQIIKDTLEGAIKAGVVKPTDKFDKATQDKIFVEYLVGSKRPAIGEFLEGNATRSAAALAFAQEWASMPVAEDTYRNGKLIKRGQSYYDGVNVNKAGMKIEDVEASLDEAKATYDRLIQQGYPKEEARKAALLGLNSSHPQAGIPTQNVSSNAEALIPKQYDPKLTQSIVNQPNDLAQLLTLSAQQQNNQQLNNTIKNNNNPFIIADNFIDIPSSNTSLNKLNTDNEQVKQDLPSLMAQTNQFMESLKQANTGLTAAQEQAIKEGTLATDKSRLSVQEQATYEQMLQQATVTPDQINIPKPVTNDPRSLALWEKNKVNMAKSITQRNIAALENQYPNMKLLTGKSVSAADLGIADNNPFLPEVLKSLGMTEQDFANESPKGQQDIIESVHSYANKLENLAREEKREREVKAKPDVYIKELLKYAPESDAHRKELGLTDKDFKGKKGEAIEYAIAALSNTVLGNSIQIDSTNRRIISSKGKEKNFTPEEIGSIIKETGDLYEKMYYEWADTHIDLWGWSNSSWQGDASADTLFSKALSQAMENFQAKKYAAIKAKQEDALISAKDSVQSNAQSRFFKGK